MVLPIVIHKVQYMIHSFLSSPAICEKSSIKTFIFGFLYLRLLSTIHHDVYIDSARSKRANPDHILQ